MMQYLLLLDRYTNKVVYLPEENVSIESLKIGEKLLYTTVDAKNWSVKKSLWTLIKKGELLQDTGKEIIGTFYGVLEGETKQRFEEEQKRASDLFPLFKKAFKKEFPTSVPITARYQIFSEQLFLYFYSEERFVFTEFVKNLRQEIPENIFLFQVGARDMIRISPAMDHVFCNGDVKLCCKNNMILQNIEIENIISQNLEGRDIERLKGRCGKLKCCLLYEMNVYIEEGKKYPQKGNKISLSKELMCKNQNCEDKEICEGIVLSYNIMNQEIKIKTKEGIMRISLDKLKS